MSMQWLRERAPGFNDLTEEECSAIADFSLLWSLFEARILDSSGSAARICTVVDAWRVTESLQAEAYDPELMYFRQRYFADGDVTHHFDNLNLRESDQPDLVRSVIDGTNDDPRDCMVTILIIVLRFRNNLFHGIKWQYQLAGQLTNFTNANNILMKALEQHGELAAS